MSTPTANIVLHIYGGVVQDVSAYPDEPTALATIAENQASYNFSANDDPEWVHIQIDASGNVTDWTLHSNAEYDEDA